MTKELITQNINSAIVDLICSLRDLCFNKISNNYSFILTEIGQDNFNNFNEKRIERKKVNDKITPKSLIQIIDELFEFYSSIYDLNFYIYKANKNETLIEIQYFLKSSQSIEYFEKIKDNIPMIHCKIAIPPYSYDSKEKFDINWEHGGLIHNWKMFWWRLKIKRIIDEQKVK